MSNQDIFLFPSKAECSSIALCEANGFGLPCFVFDTGGLSNYVINGKNGYRLSVGSEGNDFANKVKTCIENNEIDRLSLGAREFFEMTLNWNVWGEKLKNIIK